MAISFLSSTSSLNIFSLRTLVWFALGLNLIACSHMPFGHKEDVAPVSEIPKVIPEEGYKPSEHYGAVNLNDNAKVDQWINYFTGRGRKYMHIYLERSARYIPMMKAAFRERGMPDELTYIAMIESGFSPTAFSQASAVGYWQFIRATGKRYNLRIDKFVDERRDPILSTQAAASYLDSLFSIFGDWHLSLSAYNSGEQRVLRAMRKYHTRDFWDLARIRKALPNETDNYVPKYIAAVRIAQDPEKYGFTDINFQPAFSYDSVVIDKPISLETLAKEMNIEYEDLKIMNPRYKSDFIPVYADRINAVRVPAGMKDLAIAAVPKCSSSAPKIYVAEFEYYKIRRGDTLSHIARRYRTSIARIRDLNDMSRRTFIRVGQKLKVPDSAGNTIVVADNKSSEDTSSPRKSVVSRSHRNAKSSSINRITRLPSKVSEPGDNTVHIVRRGENLSTIARKYRTSVSEIARVNSLGNRSKLFVGIGLVIPN